MQDKTTKPVIFSWFINPNTGRVLIDTYLEIIKKDSEEIKSLNAIFLRIRFQLSNLALFHVELNMTRKKLQNFFDKTPFDIIKEKLKKAEVRMQDIIREKESENSIEYIKYELDED